MIAVDKCKLCDDEKYFGDYCIDCWPGYDCCADPACHHYRCEHDLHFGPPIYVKPGREHAVPMGSIDINGCANAGCKCELFKESA